jgi:hypothetical protein
MPDDDADNRDRSRDDVARKMADQIVGSADNFAYLAEALGGGGIPDAWSCGPAFEVRVRFRESLDAMSDADLHRRLDALAITGPLRMDRLADVALRRALQPGDLSPDRRWRPRAFGLWRVADGNPLGVKVYASARRGVDLLLAIPPRFLDGYRDEVGFGFTPGESYEPPDGLCRLYAALLDTAQRAQTISQIDAMHPQDQAWCEPFAPEHRGFLVPQAVAIARGWPTTSGDPSPPGWRSVSLDDRTLP